MMLTARALADLERTRANTLQLGVVQEADYAKARLRVQVAGLTSAWLPWLAVRAGGDRTWAAPEVGEQVLIGCPDGDPARGVVLGAIFKQDHAAPAASADLTRTVYADGAVIEYDRAAHKLTATLPAGGAATLTAPGGCTIIGPTEIRGTLRVTAAVTADSTVTVTGATTLSSTLAVTGAATLSSSLSVAGALTGGVGGVFSLIGSQLNLSGSLTATGEIAAATLKMGGQVLTTTGTPNVHAGTP